MMFLKFWIAIASNSSSKSQRDSAMISFECKSILSFSEFSKLVITKPLWPFQSLGDLSSWKLQRFLKASSTRSNSSAFSISKTDFFLSAFACCTATACTFCTALDATFSSPCNLRICADRFKSRRHATKSMLLSSSSAFCFSTSFFASSTACNKNASFCSCSNTFLAGSRSFFEIPSNTASVRSFSISSTSYSSAASSSSCNITAC
mmetsp:Transcript_26668/g.42684  ORF Transcript_26668/g.42684 Transcript_26668/m.42684 type:complete len:206 (-) Transcript_26668:124-741(-)